MDQIEAMCTVSTIPFDSDDLAQAEEQVTAMRNLLRKTRARVRDGRACASCMTWHGIFRNNSEIWHGC
jgi:hypothetical protein